METVDKKGSSAEGGFWEVIDNVKSGVLQLLKFILQLFLIFLK